MKKCFTLSLQSLHLLSFHLSCGVCIFLPFHFFYFITLKWRLRFLSFYFLILSFFEKLTNLHMLKSGRLISNACDRNQQVDVCLQIRRYFAIMGSADYQQVMSYLLFFVFKYPPFYPLKPHLLNLKSICFSPQKMMFYQSKAMLSQLQTYAFRKSMLVFVKINAYFFVELKC